MSNLGFYDDSQIFFLSNVLSNGLNVAFCDQYLAPNDVINFANKLRFIYSAVFSTFAALLAIF